MKRYVLFLAFGAFLAYSCQHKPAEQAQQSQPTEKKLTEEVQEQKHAEQPKTQEKPQEQKPAEQPRVKTEPKPQEKKPTAQVAQAPIKDMLAFAQQKGCFACHDINVKKVGPALKEVAKKLAGQPNVEEELAKRIKNGGVGTWGQVPMPPQNVTEQEAKDLARWVLSLK